MLEELEDDEAADGVADEGELAVGRHVLLDEGDLVLHLAQDTVQRLVACGNQWQVSLEYLYLFILTLPLSTKQCL